jgi:hypothetical protein
MDRCEVVVECGLDPGCHDVELHLRRGPATGRRARERPDGSFDEAAEAAEVEDDNVYIFCVASYGTMEEAEKHAERIRLALTRMDDAGG